VRPPETEAKPGDEPHYPARDVARTVVVGEADVFLPRHSLASVVQRALVAQEAMIRRALRGRRLFHRLPPGSRRPVRMIRRQVPVQTLRNTETMTPSTTDSSPSMTS
jgi:hypothetical protein